MTDFQKLGTVVKKMQADGVPEPQIDAWLKQANTDLATLNASGFGPNPTSAERPSKLSSFIQGTGQGTSMNYGDEIGAALAATIGRPTSNGLEPIPGQDWTSRYEAARDEIRKKIEETKQANPKTFTAGQITGVLAPAILAPELYGSSYIAKAPTMLNMMGRSAAVGGAFGGANAFGAAQGTPTEQATQAAIGAGTGAAVGAAVPPLVKGATAIGQGIYDRIKSAVSPTQVISEAPSTAVANVADDAFNAVKPPVTAEVTANERIKAISEVSKALQRDGYSVDQVKAMLNTLGPDATLADISDATQRLLRTQKSAPGAAGQIITASMENRQLGEQGRLLGAVQKALGTKAGVYESDDALLQRLSEESAPLYQKAFQETPQVDPTKIISTIDQSLQKVPAKSPIRAAVERARSMLGETDEAGNFRPYTDLETLHNAKVAIDDMLSNFGGDQSLGKMSKRAVMQIKDQLLQAMDEASPTYKQARESFSGLMSGRDALEAGRSFIREDAEAIARKLADLPKEDRELYRVGGLKAIAEIIGSKPTDVSVVQLLRKSNLLDKVRELVPDEAAFKAYIQDLNNARRFAMTRATVLGGSQTAEKLLDAAEQARSVGGVATDIATGNKVGLLSRAAKTLSNMVGPGEGTRAAIADALVTKDPAKINEILKQISALARAQAATNQGAAVGAITGAQTAGSAVPGVFGRKR